MTVCGEELVASRFGLLIFAAIVLGAFLVAWPTAQYVANHFERRDVHRHVQRRLHVHDFVIVRDTLGEPAYGRCICGAKPPRERITSG